MPSLTLANSLRATITYSPFSPASLFSGGAPGVWYDPSDYGTTGTLFQDSAGTTPVTAVEQPVGLMLDKSQGLVLGPELVVNGWTDIPTTVSSIVGGKLRVVGGTNGTYSNYSIATKIGTRYKITFNATVVLPGTFYVIPKSDQNGGGSNLALFNGSSNTSVTATFVATTTAEALFIQCSGIWDFDNISVRELPGNHAFQSTSASRPVLSARYNLLTKTEQFNDAAWTKQEVTLTANATTSPIGGSNGTSIVPTATTNQFRIFRNPDPSISAQNGIYVKANGYTKVALRDAGGTSGMYAAFDLASVSVINPGSSANASIVSAGNGWFKISAVFTTAANQRFSLHVLSPSYASGVVDVTWTANGTSGIYIWGASLVPANQSTLPYQRVNTSTDYNTTGFLPYLRFDGVDDSLSTNSISFTSTDKMSVFAGVRKLSDAAAGMLAELSAAAPANNGAFYVAAPDTVATYGFALRGTTNISRNASTYTAPITNVLAALFDIAQATLATELKIRINAATPGTIVDGGSADVGTGNFGNYPLYIGRRNNASIPFNGQIYSMIIVGKAVNAVELTSTETYTAIKTGVTL